MVTIPRFLPSVSEEVPNPIETMRQRLSRKTTLPMVFPARSLFAFECVPLLLEKIHAGLSTATFLDDLAACANPLTILTVQDVVAVENDLRLTISFAITPEEERLLLLDEVEDTQVTSLLQKLLSGETFGVEDFPGEDTSFCPKVDNAHGADQCGEENPVPNPVHRRNLRPRKPVDVKIQDISSEEDSEPAVFPCSNECTYEKMQAFLARDDEKISTQIKEMERNIRRDLGLPERIIVIAVRGKQSDDNHSGKRRKTVASASVVKTHSYSLRAGGGDRTAAVERPGVEKKVSAKGRAAATLDRLPRQDDQQPQTPSTALILYRDPLCVQPQSYVLPPEVPSIFHYGAEGGSPVAWEKTNPHRYRSVGSVRSCHPPRGAKFDSKANVTSTGSGNVAAPDYIMKAALEGDRLGHIKSVTAQYAPPDLSVEAQETIVPDASTGEVSGVQETIVPDASTGEVSGVQEAVTPTAVDYSQQEENRHERDLDPLGPGTEENIASRLSGENIQKAVLLLLIDTGAPVDADERYDICKEDISADTGCKKPELIRCRAEEDSKVGAGKRQRKRSRKLTGVYEADPRLKKLFDSAKKVEYKPMEETDSAVFEEFRTVLSENTDSTFQINTGHSVDNRFFLDMAEPQKWLTDEHMHVLMNMLWRRRGKHLHKDGIVIFDQYFTKTILSYWSEFEAANDKLKFEWGPNIPKYVTGKRRWQSMKLELGRDVYTVYAPMNWGGDHWVGLRIDLKDSQVMIYDSFVPHNSDEEVDEYLRPLIQSLPYILEKYAGFTHGYALRVFITTKGVATVVHVLLSSLRCMLLVLGRRR
ncbi:LOW QUALITY PROTEIN: hypothetical protein Bca4012_025385 [Brassica carinata]